MNIEPEENDRFYILLWSNVMIFFTPIFVSMVVKYFIKSSEEGEKKNDNTKTLFSYMNLATAGIFIGVSFFHILSESTEKFSNQDDPYLIFLCGFFSMTIIDHLLVGHDHSHETENKKTKQRQELQENDFRESFDENIFKFNSYNEFEHLDFEKLKINSDKALLWSIYLSISLHSFLGGFALGSQVFQDEKAKDEEVSFDLASLIFFFCIHKAMDTLAITSRLFQNEISDIKFWIMITIFSLITPSGIIVSYTISKSSKLKWIDKYVQPFSGGILLYVSLFDILIIELQNLNLNLINQQQQHQHHQHHQHQHQHHQHHQHQHHQHQHHQQINNDNNEYDLMKIKFKRILFVFITMLSVYYVKSKSEE